MKNLDELLLVTTDTGSLPLEDDFDADRRNVGRAILDKTAVGLEYPCYPQLAGTHSKPMNMGLQFLIPLSEASAGIQIKGQEVHLLSDQIVEPPSPIGIERAEYFQTFLRTNGLIDNLGGVKACVTGPFTLASYIDSSNFMTCGASRTNVVSALARILSRSCKRLNELGFDLINIDEPFLALMLGREHQTLFNYDENFVTDSLNTLVTDVSCPTAIHVCGTVTPGVKSVLLESEIDILDHEFSASPQNLKAYTREDLESSGKFLAFGCVSSSNPRIESVEEISTSIRNALQMFGPRIVVKPDCGFAGLQATEESYAIALRKMKNMVQAARKVRTVNSGNWN